MRGVNPTLPMREEKAGKESAKAPGIQRFLRTHLNSMELKGLNSQLPHVMVRQAFH